MSDSLCQLGSLTDDERLCVDRCPCGDVTLCGTRTAYVYAWGNNPRRADLKGRTCVIEATGAMGTALVAFVDTGERVTTSRRALRRMTYA